MGLMRRQIDDDLGVALTQKTVEIGIIRARTEALLGCSCPRFNLVADSDQGRLIMQPVKLWKIDTLRHLTAPHHPNIYGAHDEIPPPPTTLVRTRRGQPERYAVLAHRRARMASRKTRYPIT